MEEPVRAIGSFLEEPCAEVADIPHLWTCSGPDGDERRFHVGQYVDPQVRCLLGPALLCSRLLHDSIRAGEHKSLMPVLKANEEGWTAVRSTYLDNLSPVLGRPDLLAVNVQPVADLGLHHILLSDCLSVSKRVPLQPASRDGETEALSRR
jgi:hypothetical protein